ncbi:MAG: response regulator transcription factor [Thermoleophilaceae bacterium]|nr:response regulator transcription factor [Thermoleophilaceae bacterium]
MPGALERVPPLDERRTRIRVVVAEDAYLVREALIQLLAQAPQLDVVGAYEDRDSLLEAIDVERPDAVVTDIRMPPTGSDEGIQVAHALRETHPEIGVVVLSQFVEARYPLALLASGSAGRAYLLKENVHDRHQLVSAIEAVVAGESFIDPRVVEVLVEAQARRESPLSELTAREHEVLALIARGLSNAAIADSLSLTKRAVEKHINAIFMKLNLSNAQDVSRRVKAALMFLADEE